MRKPKPKVRIYGFASSPGRPVYSEVILWTRLRIDMGMPLRGLRQKIADQFMISLSTVSRIMKAGGIDLRKRA